MWMVNPKLMCNKHLIGEHGELHKFLPSFRKGHKVDGRFNPIIQMQFQRYQERHNSIAKEMINRGLNHKSPLENIPDFSLTYSEYYNKVVDIEVSIKDLKKRCEHCRERIKNVKF
jgi:Pyrimidine dimer DNA glycosylase